MRVRVFGGLTDHTGGSYLEVEVPDDGTVTVADLRAAIASACPPLTVLLPQTKVAIDLAVAEDTDRIPPGAEVALLPPVAGGAGPDPTPEPHLVTGLVAPPLDLGAALARIASPRAGATAVFLGTVRDHAPDLPEVVRLEYTAYEQMAEQELRRIGRDLLAEHPALTGVALLHALGTLSVGEPTVLIACTSPHRDTAFTACRQALEVVKDTVPVFKREVTEGGSARWVGLAPGEPAVGTGQGA